MGLPVSSYSSNLKSEREGAWLAALPLDVGRTVFELTARAHPESACRLALVSRTVQSWVERIMYESIVLDFPLKRTENFLRTVESRPPSFFACHVKNLYITGALSYVQAHRIISVCTGARKLTCWVDITPWSAEGLDGVPMLHLLQHCSVKQLSVKLQTLVGLSYPPSVDLSPFLPLSHLDVVNPSSGMAEADWSWLYVLPNLRHLSFGDLDSKRHMDFFNVFEKILAGCGGLETLTVVSRDEIFISKFKLLMGEYEAGKLRLVSCFHEGKALETFWADIVRGGRDFWDVRCLGD